ncbi:hypothetical protein P4J20_22970, partial [Bacillus cereus]|nr:hypothetical protein [Bacillus cereus]
RFGGYNCLTPRFWSVRLGDIPTPAEFPKARAKEWRFFECFFKKYYSTLAFGKALLGDIEGKLVETLI